MASENQNSMTPADLKAWREHLGLSQKAAAEALGLSPRAILYYEQGERSIPLHMALACAAIVHGIAPYDGTEPQAPVISPARRPPLSGIAG